jgi:hypothetical protein
MHLLLRGFDLLQNVLHALNAGNLLPFGGKAGLARRPPLHRGFVRLRIF